LDCKETVEKGTGSLIHVWGCYVRLIFHITTSNLNQRNWGNVLYKNKELKEYSGKTTSKFVDLTGKTFGSWVVICRAPNDCAKNTRFWCECSCGKLKEVGAPDLLDKKSTQCRKCSTQKFSKNKVKMCGDIPYSIWNAIQNKSKLKNKEFLISIEYAWNIFLSQNKKCALSGQDIGFHVIRRYTKKGWKESRWIHTASLDRIDSSKGYIEGNIQWIHKDINWMKNSFNQDYFIKICKLIAEYNKDTLDTNIKYNRIRKNDPDQIVENQKILNIDEV